MGLPRLLPESLSSPVDIVELVADTHDWSFERSGMDELLVSVSGVWSDYSISFSWVSDESLFHLSCSFDLRVSESRCAEVLRLLCLINEQMLLGHFDLWFRDGIIVFRHSFPLCGGVRLSESQIEYLLSSSLSSCERYYQAFQYVVWGNLSASDALSNILFETVGEA